MTLKQAVRRGFSLLANSGRELAKLEKRSLESILEDYILLLLASGFLAGLMSLIVLILTAIYYRLTAQISVNYLHLLNFGLTVAAGTFFLYLFIGTFFVGLLALLLRPFLRLRLVMMVKLLCVALTPVLLFGWVAQRAVLVLLFWSLFLLILGRRRLAR